MADFFTENMPGMHRLFSFQRGFNLVSDSLSTNVGYARFLQIDRDLTTNMVTRDGRRSGVNVTQVLAQNAAAPVRLYMNARQSPSFYMIGFWGVDGDGDNWGHVVGVAWPQGDPQPHYFDPNEGVFATTNANQFGNDLITRIDDDYDITDINDFTIYRYQ